MTQHETDKSAMHDVGADLGSAAFDRFAGACPYRIALEVERRPGNALNVEIGCAQPRCTLKRPSNWPQSASAINWTASGGSPLVFGRCSQLCALGQRFCDCGHRQENHDASGCLVGGKFGGCSCSGFTN